ncbi:MAG: hypothetical protein K2X02_09790 [Alphaproteobacteria bacterium]|nr:hypothetical protein [Alphaproteobacteria bacterium]
MATDVTDLYCRLSVEYRLSDEECALMRRTVKFVNTPDESKALDHE